MNRRSNSKVLNVIGVIAGALLASIGLELFLIPHGIIVGGITGLSALFALTTEMKLGLFLFLLNLPLLLIQRKNIDASFAIFTIFGLLIFSLGTIFLHPYPALTSNPLPAALFGGLSLGLGIGLALRFGGALDTAEKVAETFCSKKGLSPEGIMLLLNCSILIAAGFHFGFDQAVYSVTAYILAYESVKLPLRGFRFTLSVSIKSHECARIQEALAVYLNRNVAILESPDSQSGYLGVMECKCHRWEASRLVAVIKNCDPDSEISFDV
ncbi:Uncharacterized membrane-anchored protein YitT, contains DUF161 and DUF2179 domains [Fontibacillus panacisegetis]|uniref:Uncharacterized membrane-anchored protein YitT, contains DUF161 and DUF2179 domains n=1 Tax=Fontibacillus panacisegetis TaxID=670482 RepID=A0A1G7IT33_9BACL|nr:YitT family protein [Fontibacillus panacisegetis]SDF15831.1 Uncharacterized membrane-anchored protein YitT, contains DUF161 and DUF2179 domains [Fontibacillus panacisegetis]